MLPTDAHNAARALVGNAARVALALALTLTAGQVASRERTRRAARRRPPTHAPLAMHAASVRAARRGAHLRPCGAAPRRSSTTRRSARRVPCAARRRGEEAYEEAEDEEEDEATAALREKLMQQYDAAQEDPEREPLDGWALRELMQDKWGASYEVRIVRRSDPLGVKRFYCQVRECEVVHPPRAPRRGPTAM